MRSGTASTAIIFGMSMSPIAIGPASQRTRRKNSKLTMLSGKALGFVASLVLLAGLLSFGFAAASVNTVPKSGIGQSITTITANALKPAACASLNLTAIVVGSGSFRGTAANELMLGSAGDDT